MEETVHSIGTSNESSLHSSLKTWYSHPGDSFEVNVDGYIVDIVRGSLLIEIQTKNFASVKTKLLFLREKYQVKLVYPIRQEKQIVRISLDGKKELSRRKSPRKGTIIDLFDELVRFPSLLDHPNVTLDVVFVVEEELRVQDGKGSWRRRGESIADRRLLDVLECRQFTEKQDLASVLPKTLAEPFSNKSIANELGITVSHARKVSYSLRKMELIQKVGKKGNEYLFIRCC